MSAIEDALMRGAIAGDREALEALMELLAPAVRASLRGKVPKRCATVIAVGDVVKETFVDALLDIADSDACGEGSFERWLVTLARRDLADADKMLRAAMRAGDRQPDYLSGGKATSTRLAGSAGTPSRWLVRQETRAYLNQAIDSLTLQLRPPAEEIRPQGLSDRSGVRLARPRPGAVCMMRARAVRRLPEFLGGGSSRSVG